jgi:biopolymer transport protein ExbD
MTAVLTRATLIIGAAICVGAPCVAVLLWLQYRSSAETSVKAITISIDKNGSTRIIGVENGNQRLFSAAEFPNILASMPSVTSKTRITLSADRDVPAGLLSIMREWLAMNRYAVVSTTESDRGDEIVLVSVRSSGECQILGKRHEEGQNVHCSGLIALLKQRFPETARTEVSLGPDDDVTEEQVNLIRSAIQAGGYRFGKVLRAVIITKPGDSVATHAHSGWSQ